MDVILAIVFGGILWLADTFIDVSPVFLMIGDSQYNQIPWLYETVSMIAVFGVFLTCGFAEVFTTSLQNIFATVSQKDGKK